MLLAWFRQRDSTKEGHNGPVGVYGLSIGLEEAVMLLKEGAVTEV
jgi:predicted transcriptional regulator